MTFRIAVVQPIANPIQQAETSRLSSLRRTCSVMPSVVSPW
jgi:hypothetical protein